TFRADASTAVLVGQFEPFGFYAGGIFVAMGDLTSSGLPQVVCGADAAVPITFGLGGSITAGALPPAVLGQPYNQTITASGGGAGGGDLVLTFVQAGPLPPGLTATVNGNKLTISGTPTGLGSVDFQIKADDRAGANGLPLVNVWALDGSTQLSVNFMAFESG